MKRMALCGVVIACCFISAVAMADAAVKTRPPLPKPKPAEIAAPEPERSAPQADKTGRAPVLPREQPVQSQENPFVPAPKPEAKPETEQGQEEEKPAPGDDFATCRIELGKLGAKFSVPEIQATESRCHIANPVQISAIPSASPPGLPISPLPGSGRIPARP